MASDHRHDDLFSDPTAVPGQENIQLVNPHHTVADEPQQEGRDVENGQPAVVLTEAMFDRLRQNESEVRPYVLVEGQSRTKQCLLDREMQKIYRCTTMKQLLQELNASRERWNSFPVFHAANYSLEPFEDGEKEDVLVRIHVDENPATREVGVYTTEGMMPEVRFGLKNLGGKGYTLDGHYIPPASKLHSAQLTFTSFTPVVGDRCEYSIARRNEGNQLHAGDMERVTEGRMVTTFGLPNSAISPWCSTYTLAFQRHLYTAKERVPSYLEEHFNTPQHRIVARKVLRFSNVKTHQDGFASVYALPISGAQVTMVTEAIRSVNFLVEDDDKTEDEKINEVARLIKQRAASGSRSGSLAPSREHGSTLIKHETQGMYHIQLLKTVILDLGLRVGGSFRVNDDLSAHIATESDLPLCDRHFLNWRHVRGHRNIGPSTLSAADHFPDEEVTQYRALGGNVVWAAQASLNFPFLPYPPNGLIAMHAFANAGNIGLFSSGKDLYDSLQSFLTSPTCSIGIGIVVTKLPFFGALSGGRLEANVSLPIRLDSSDGPLTEPKDKRLFSRWHFGLHWVNAAVCGGHN